MVGSGSEFGRPGRRAELARELHEAFVRHGIELLPGRARQMLDESVRDVAAQGRFSERTALNYLPHDWAERTAADVAFQQEQSQIAERNAVGDVELTTTRVGSLVAGLAVVVQNNVWRVVDNNLPASIGEALDCLTGLALSLAPSDCEVTAPRAELLAAARLLGNESDGLRQGRPSTDDEHPPRRAAAIERLASDAAWARRLAQWHRYLRRSTSMCLGGSCGRPRAHGLPRRAGCRCIAGWW